MRKQQSVEEGQVVAFYNSPEILRETVFSVNFKAGFLCLFLQSEEQQSALFLFSLR